MPGNQSRTLSPLQMARAYEREQRAKISAHERPLIHLTPLVGWMNDPNGFCYYKGEYHLFYQYYPYNTVWGTMHWGHAKSADLIHWTYLPCALAPDTAADAGGCFSGSAVELPDGRLMLIYTGVQPSGTEHRELQAQCVAFGDGIDFVKSSQNPVIQHADLPDPKYSPFDFRDPKAWMGKDGKLYLVVGNRHDDREGSVLLFCSDDGLKWQFVTELDSGRDTYNGMWECPDFFELDGYDVLLVSPMEMRAKKEFHAGHCTLAALGHYDAQGKQFLRESVQPVDSGLDFFAPQTTLAPDGRRIMIGWMENWETCDGAPRRHPWFGHLSFPRELSLRDGRLIQQPIREIERLWRDTVEYHDEILAGRKTFEGVRGRLIDMTVTLRLMSAACHQFILHVAEDERYYTEIRLDLVKSTLTFDRSLCGSNRDIVHTRRILTEMRDGQLTLRLILDKECVELFVGNGERALASLIDTPAEIEGISFSADAPIKLDIEMHRLA